MRLPNFQRTHRMTLMPVVSANGSISPALFFFHGKAFPYRTAMHDCVMYTETYASLLPRNSLFSVREKGCGVYSDNDLCWRSTFCRAFET